MKRRNFLKSLLSTGVMLSPVTALIGEFALPDISTEAAFDRTPYSILLKNTSDRVVKQVDMLGSSEYINHPGFAGLNKLVLDGVEISSLSESSTYLETLCSLMMSPVTIDKMVIERSNKAHVFDPLQIKTMDASGTRLTVPILPTKYRTPYDDTADSVCVEVTFRLDGFTKIVFENLQPGELLAVRLYPSTDVVSMKQELPEFLKNRVELLRSKN